MPIDLFAVQEAPTSDPLDMPIQELTHLTLKWLHPVTHNHEDFPTTVWKTECGRYLVTRCVAAYSGDHWSEIDNFSSSYSITIKAAPYDGRGNRLKDPFRGLLKNGFEKVVWYPLELSTDGMPRRFKHLDTAIIACEEHAQAHLGVEYIESNLREIVASAKHSSIDCLPQRKPLKSPVIKEEVVRVEAVGGFGLDDIEEPVDLFSEV